MRYKAKRDSGKIEATIRGLETVTQNSLLTSKIC